MKSQLRSLRVALIFGAASACYAVQPFTGSATTTDSLPPVDITAGGKNFFDFLDSLTKAQGQFQLLDNRPYSASVSFLGVENAMRFITNATGSTITLILTPSGFSRTFTGLTKEDVNNQLDEFFKREGATTIADFLKAIAKTSPIAVTDGNPTSATAVAANSVFAGQGFTSADELMDGADANGAASKAKFGGISIGLNAGKFEAGPFEGTVYDISGTVLNFGGEKVRLVVPVNFNFLELEGGSQVGGAGINICLPIRFTTIGKESSWNWRVTPMGGLSVRGSVDLTSLSPLWQAGVINTLDYKVSPKIVLSLVNQLTMHKSIALAYDDLDFDPQIDQQILKNGVRISTPFSRRVIFNAFAVDTRFLKEAAVDQFWTLGTSLAFRVTQRWNLVLGGSYDTGDSFKAYSLGFSSAWKW
jgi:hypothetical protein